jgi:hypothetical protein
VSTIINEPGKGREFPILENVYTQDEAASRYCPLSMGGDRSFCQGSGCMAFVWLPGQRDARTARGRCGMVPAAPVGAIE